ncbi:hypothetical protein [Cellvibrio polysaccharolyticus]|uniref:Uncharacterized protein n=1 Tax=Cellvibrio polysaccharolyticus TaxID=2082724 RepID=A0A928YVH3_9GAMM|nr:hypothetical protein [Cellvibrio polysaccharolyticus]MBE8717073.1 hypothetical protein [Cellvibrio polysaccharolyticus]
MARKTATPRGRQRIQVMVTLPPELRKRVEQLGKAEKRSMTSICRRMVVDALERIEPPKTTRPKGARI